MRQMRYLAALVLTAMLLGVGASPPLSAPTPGLYLFSLFVRWRDGDDVTYGFLVQVY